MQLIIDLSLHKKAKLTRKKFLSNVSCIEGIRTNDNYAKEKIYLCPNSFESCMVLNHLRAAITEGDFEGINEYYGCHHAGIEVTDSIYRWFKNTDEFLMRKQIICWLATIFMFDNEAEREITQRDVYAPFFEEIQKVISDHFSKIDLRAAEDLTEFQRMYHEVAYNYYGSVPPEFLWQPTQLFQPDKAAVQWGVSDSFGSISIRRFYFSRSDWKRVVLDGESDTLLRAESSREMWEKIKYQFVAGAKNNEYVFSPFKSTERRGNVYLLRKADTSHFKIGYTGGNPSLRLASLQTANPEPLALVGSFPCIGRTTERLLHETFSAERLGGEWFCLTDEDTKNILDVEWRVAQCIF